LLVVEDDDDNRELTAIVLQSPVWTIELAGTYDEAERQISRRENGFDCALVDLILDGFRPALALMPGKWVRPFVVCVTAHADAVQSYEACERGSWGLFVKSWCDPALLERLARVSALAYLLRQGSPQTEEHRRVFAALVCGPLIPDLAAWQHTAAVSERQLQYLCEANAGMAPRYVLALHQALACVARVRSWQGVHADPGAPEAVVDCVEREAVRAVAGSIERYLR